MEVILVLFVIIPIAVIIYKYMTTPVKRWSEFFTRETLEEKAERLSKKYEVQIIKGHRDKNKAIKQLFYVLPIALIVSLPTVLFLKRLKVGHGCGESLGVLDLTIVLYVVRYGAGMMILVVTSVLAFAGCKCFREGFLPVRKNQAYKDYIRRGHPRFKVFGFLCMFAPLMSIPIFVSGDKAYDELVQGGTLNEFESQIIQDCFDKNGSNRAPILEN